MGLWLQGFDAEGRTLDRIFMTDTLHITVFCSSPLVETNGSDRIRTVYLPDPPAKSGTQPASPKFAPILLLLSSLRRMSGTDRGTERFGENAFKKRVEVLTPPPNEFSICSFLESPTVRKFSCAGYDAVFHLGHIEASLSPFLPFSLLPRSPC